MAKTKSAMQTGSSDRKDNFFVRAKNNTLSKKSSFAPRKQQNTSSKDNKHIPKTVACSSGFFLEKSFRSGGQADNNDQSEKTSEKKPFDKKQWRIKKYSKKYKLQQWEDKRKKVVSREYYKQIKHDKPGLDVQKLYAEESAQDDDDDDGESVPSEQDHGKKTRKNQTVQNRYEQSRYEKEEKKVAAQRKQEERKLALEAYKKKKHEKFRKLNMKNKKGQPIMKHRMEMLLEEIQKTCT